MSSVNKTGRTLVLFRKNNFDAFVAAFIYWWLFGKDSVRSTDTIVADAPKIAFRAVDVFENVLEKEFTHERWTPAVKGYIGTGDTVVSIGINLPYVPAATAFFSYENDTTFEQTYDINATIQLNDEMPEGCQYFYEPRKMLSEMLLESLIEARHLSIDESVLRKLNPFSRKVDTNKFRLLNQFFRFYDGRGGGFHLPDEVSEKILTYFPQLRVEDFKELDQAITNSLAFYESRRRISPEDAVRQHIRQGMVEAFEMSEEAEAYRRQTGITLRLVNSEQALSAQPTYFRNASEATFVYRHVKGGVRGHYYSSPRGENALRVFPEGRPVIGNEHQAEWFITFQDFYSLQFDAPTVVPPTPMPT